jgi:hypothetical protein
MVNATPPELDFCGKAILAALAVCLPCLPFMRRKWPGRVCSVGGWLIFLLSILHQLGV